MAVFRIERTRDYTVMSNHHLRDKALSLKSKGLLSMMLSLPEDWNYTTRGLAKICKEGVDAIGGADFPHEVVRSRFLKLDSSHIEFVMECLHNNTTEVRNMKQYLLTVLFNAPTTMNNHYTAQVNHDMHAGGW